MGKLDIRGRIGYAGTLTKTLPFPNERFPDVGVASDVYFGAVDARLMDRLSGHQRGVMGWCWHRMACYGMLDQCGEGILGRACEVASFETAADVTLGEAVGVTDCVLSSLSCPQ